VIRSARRDNRVVGVAAAWAEPLGGHIAVLVAPDDRRQGIGGHLLAHLELALRRAEWPYHSLDALGPVGFYRQRSRWSVALPVD
jgi:GNAT superfamily N-acetyltransferase